MECSAPRFYILTADEETWKVALQELIWGFSDRTVGQWNTTRTEDYVAFYVTAPVKRIVGFGKVAKKFIDESLAWPDEKLFKKAIWKHRLKFNVIFVVDDWDKGISVPSEIMLNTGRKVVPKEIFFTLAEKAEAKWACDIMTKLTA